MREFVRKRDQRKCLLCGASNTPPDTALIVAGSPWDEIELEWLKERGLVPESFNAIHPQNIISLCPNHHELFLHRRWCFVPCAEDRHAMRIHEERDMQERLYRRTLGPAHDQPRTLPQLSGKFDFLNCAFGDDALSLTPAGGRMTLVSTMPPHHESAQTLPRPPQYPLPGVNPFVVLAHAAKCVGGPRKPIFPEVEQEIADLVLAYNVDLDSFPPPQPYPNQTQSPNVQTYHSPRESTSTHNSDSEPESRSSSPTSMDAPPPAPIHPPPPSARGRAFPKASAAPSPEQGYHTPYGISRQDTGQSHYSTGHFAAPTNTAGTQPIPIFRPPSSLATGTQHPNLMAEGTSPSSGTGTGGERDRNSIPPPPPIPHHLQPQTNMPPHIQQQMTGTAPTPTSIPTAAAASAAAAAAAAAASANSARRRASDNPPPPVQINNPAPPGPPSAQAFAQQSQSFPQYAQYPSVPAAGVPREGPGLTRRSSKLRHSEDLRGTIRSPPPIPIGVTTGMGPRSPDRDRVVSGGAGDRIAAGVGGPKSPDVPHARRESQTQFPRPRERERERERDRERDRDSRGEPFVFGPDISAAEIITRLTEGRNSAADFSGRRRNGST
ncbi:hypothetical protein RSOLAG22IIIB_02359 [Rhizoctonia solani]|uniref:HNH nuclease domain-containing protein n=1 Tax=Rhizoctonia solani TaxID=456999 RepID=A0A0K6GEH6_9AGAM|nr:hypothetical protein RSOLAG22IIIB_02359 [Rhizoctonia solani]